MASPRASSEPLITLAHGEGGRAMRRLLRERIVPPLTNSALAALGDAALLPEVRGSLLVTTDSSIVSPLFFPGGDIGRLAVFSSVNDLAVAGARPLALTLSIIAEEGLPLATLDRVIASVAAAAAEAGAPVVAGDTKVAPRGAVDQLFLSTTGIGVLVPPAPSGPQTLAPGDCLLVTAPLGRHGVAVLNARHQLGFDPPPESDCGSLFPAVEALRAAGVECRALRDATRGGVAAVLHEWAASCGHTFRIDESRLPIDEVVRGACELLGLDPLHLANEGAMVVAIPPAQENAALEALRSAAVSRGAERIGEVVPSRGAPVVVTRGRRDIPLDEPSGAPLPRIC